jgi:drug/metabolite transporter (DMT)-like permease
MFIRFIPPVFVLLWSTGWIVAKFGAFHASPLLFLTIRFGLAIAVFAVICALTGARWLQSRQAVLHAIVSGVFLHGVYLTGVWWGIAEGVPAGISGLISAMQPLMTAIAAPLLIGERLTSRQKLGLGLGFLGILIAIAPQLVATDASRLPLIPVAVNIVGMVGVTYGSIYQKQHLHSGDLRTIALLQYVGALIFVGAIAYFFETPHFDNSIAVWATLSWSVLALSAGAIALLLYLLRHGQASQAASLSYLVPAAVALQAWILFGEHLTAPMVAGAVVAAAGVYLTSRKAVAPPA